MGGWVGHPFIHSFIHIHGWVGGWVGGLPDAYIAVNPSTVTAYE